MTARIPASEPMPRTGMVVLELEGFRCERCEHEWLPRGAYKTPTRLPIVCPKCKSPHWNMPRRKAETDE